MATLTIVLHAGEEGRSNLGNAQKYRCFFYGRSSLTLIIWAGHLYIDCLVKEIMIRLRGGAVRFI